MPFIAKNKKTGERIDITTLDNPKAIFKAGDCICQLCNSPLNVRSQHFRSGYKIRSHFYHRGDCDGEFEAHPESPEHLFGKIYLREELRKLYSQWADVEIELEVPIRMDWRPKGRIADIMVTWPMGWREAHEIQLASITPEKLQERTDDYERCGINVTWWLGGRAENPSNREWCIRIFGESLGLFFEMLREDTPYPAGTNNGF